MYLISVPAPVKIGSENPNVGDGRDIEMLRLMGARWRSYGYVAA